MPTLGTGEPGASGGADEGAKGGGRGGTNGGARAGRRDAGQSPRRVLVVLPSWVGDAVMATPALRLLRSSLPGAFIGGLARPGIDRVLEGLDLFDELHLGRATGVLGPKHVAAKLRPRAYDTAVLLSNSFSSALIARIAGVPRRVGYDRDGRGILLTDRLRAPRTPGGAWALVPAVAYYLHAALCVLDPAHDRALALPRVERADRAPLGRAEGLRLELAVTPGDAEQAERMLVAMAVGGAFAVINPGGNDEAKRWPAERFGAVAAWLWREHRLASLVNGSPAEAALVRAVIDAARAHDAGTPVHSLPDAGGTLGSLKALLARARVLVTNDTGPRHMAIAMRTPTVALFGPTDPRWTTVPTREPTDRGPAIDGLPIEALVLADPTLPPGESANDHPARCAIRQIAVERVLVAVGRVLVVSGGEPGGGGAAGGSGPGGAGRRRPPVGYD